MTKLSSLVGFLKVFTGRQLFATIHDDVITSGSRSLADGDAPETVLKIAQERIAAGWRLDADDIDEDDEDDDDAKRSASLRGKYQSMWALLWDSCDTQQEWNTKAKDYVGDIHGSVQSPYRECSF